MTYSLWLERTPNYLHVRVTGANTVQNVARYLMEVAEHCRELKCGNVLVEEHLEGPRLNTFEVFKVVESRTEGSPRAIRRLAYVDTNMATDPAMMKFAETVAVNRGLNVRVFGTVGEAEGWLEAG